MKKITLIEARNQLLKPLGQPASITDARSGRMVAFEYDALGRLVGVRDPRVVEEGGLLGFVAGAAFGQRRGPPWRA